jgi:menaquinone-9 beta-reductase
MNTDRSHDLAIIGGGLAGLSLSIQLARKGWRIALFEKETFPFHKVCGEYVSMESRSFLLELGLPLDDWSLPEIHELWITTTRGPDIKTPLPLGGFGISRFKLDAALAEIARNEGVNVFENCKVHDIHFEEDGHKIETSAGLFKSRVAAACYGKKTNLDVKWKRSFLQNRKSKNYVGIKYHISADLPEQEIALHNFPGGYCGVSKIEEGRYCLCYLTLSENLKNNGQSISVMEENVLKKNPELRNLLDKSVTLFSEPVTISQISFSKKTQLEKHILCIGDAAGMITPLCGNGMSMALHASKIAAGFIDLYLKNIISRSRMEKSYQQNWNRVFASRLLTGRLIQRFFGNEFRSAWLIRIMKRFPGLVRTLIRQTHGEKF